MIGLLTIVGFFGLLAAADAQTPNSSTAGAPFDVDIGLSLPQKSVQLT
jgi:hypothetical protein